MTGWQRPSLLLLGAALIFTGGPRAPAAISPVSRVPARASAAACGNVHLFMLPWLRARDTATASKAGKELRDALNDKFDSKEWCVIPKERTDGFLKASQFPTNAVLTDLDALQLAGPVRADVFLQSEYKDYQYSGTIFFFGDDHAWMRERVPAPAAARSTSQAASSFALKIKDVLKEYEPAKRCLSLAIREQKFADAHTAAQQAIAAFPDGVIGRYCMALAMQGEKRPPDEVLKVVNDVLARDTDNPRALILAIQMYEAKADTSAYERVAQRFVMIDPTNAVVESIIQRLADWHRTDAALAFIAKTLIDDPENKTVLGIEFRLIYSAGRWKEAAMKGEALAKLDSTVVDSFFVRRIVSAYSNDSQPDRVLAWLKIGTEKFPENMSFAIGYAQKLTETNQTPKALDVYKRLIKMFPETPGVRLRIANTYYDLGQVDSAAAWLHDAEAHGEDKAQISGVSYTIGLKFLQTAQASHKTDDYKQAVPFLAYADSVNADNQAKFYLAVASITIAQQLSSTLEANPQCDVAKQASDWLAKVQPYMMGGGGRANGLGANAAQIMDALPGLSGYLDQWMKARHCQ